MSTTFNRFSKITITHGLILFGALTGFFLLMRALNLAENFYLRTINIVFVIIVIYSVIQRFHKEVGASYYEDFFDFFAIAFRTGLLGIGLFSAFLALYLDQIDPGFMQMLQEREDAGGVMSPVIAGFVVLLEGLASVVIVAFSVIQIRKSRTVEQPERKAKALDDEVKS